MLTRIILVDDENQMKTTGIIYPSMQEAVNVAETIRNMGLEDTFFCCPVVEDDLIEHLYACYNAECVK